MSEPNAVAKMGRPVMVPNSKTVKFIVSRDEWAAVEQLAKSKQKSESAVMRDLVRAIAA
jgi:hypothetical protein